MEGTEKRREGRWNKLEKRNKLEGERIDRKRVQDRGGKRGRGDKRKRGKSAYVIILFFSPKASLLFAICVAYLVLHRNNAIGRLPKLKNAIT